METLQQSKPGSWSVLTSMLSVLIVLGLSAQCLAQAPDQFNNNSTQSAPCGPGVFDQNLSPQYQEAAQKGPSGQTICPPPNAGDTWLGLQGSTCLYEKPVPCTGASSAAGDQFNANSNPAPPQTAPYTPGSASPMVPLGGGSSTYNYAGSNWTEYPVPGQRENKVVYPNYWPPTTPADTGSTSLPPGTDPSDFTIDQSDKFNTNGGSAQGQSPPPGGQRVNQNQPNQNATKGGNQTTNVGSAQGYGIPPVQPAPIYAPQSQNPGQTTISPPQQYQGPPPVGSEPQLPGPSQPQAPVAAPPAPPIAASPPSNQLASSDTPVVEAGYWIDSMKRKLPLSEQIVFPSENSTSEELELAKRAPGKKFAFPKTFDEMGQKFYFSKVARVDGPPLMQATAIYLNSQGTATRGYNGVWLK